MASPYSSLPQNAFWRSAIADRNPFDIDELWAPRFMIARTDPLVTFGSCFAQHLSNAMQRNGFNWHNGEPAPRSVTPDVARRYNYGVFSARTGNIYTTTLLLQWTRWAIDPGTIPDIVWERDGRFFDPFRPNVEPDGFADADELRRSRLATARAFLDCIASARCFVFTLGLTESWHDVGGWEYPMCPGTVAGTFDAERHEFRNLDVATVIGSLRDAMTLMRGLNPELKFLFTVSPVPLTATNSGQHVLVATTYSKSVLRAAVGAICAEDQRADYFPSYEIISGAPFRAMFFEPNMRGVNQRGVDLVMSHVFRGLGHEQGEDTEDLERRIRRDERKRAKKERLRREATAVGGAEPAPPDGGKGRGPSTGRSKSRSATKADLVCEEEILDAFGT